MDVADKIKNVLAAAAKQEGLEIEPGLYRPNETLGDYSTNFALQFVNKMSSPPSGEIHNLAGRLKHAIKKIEGIKDVEVANAGFINIWLTDKALLKMLDQKPNQKWAGKTVVAEYSDPNPFKVLHAGHLYTSVVGDAIANLFETLGAEVHRVNFGGDVGLHVAKTMWGILQNLGGENPDKLSQIAPADFADWISKMYVAGNSSYETDVAAKQEITELNKRIYELVEQNDKTSPLAKIYWATRTWSYDYFDWFYKLIGSGFEKYYPESITSGPGLKIVKENIGKVFEKSEGAVVFKGEVHNLRTRVFINRHGLPTYETKDVGLIFMKWDDYHFDRSIIVTANEIYEYMQVVLKAVEQIKPELVERTTHITHGLVRLTGGKKMSSRSGDILRAVDVLEAAAKANQKASGKDQPAVSIGAVKYAFLKNRIGADIAFDPTESVSLEGNSGPYLQYAYARAKSILRKAKNTKNIRAYPKEFNESERSLVRKIGQYPEVVEAAANELLPSHICTYLYELAQTFNRFYEQNKVIGSDREVDRLSLVGSYAEVLKHGLGLLNIEAPERI